MRPKSGDVLLSFKPPSKFIITTVAMRNVVMSKTMDSTAKYRKLV